MATFNFDFKNIYRYKRELCGESPSTEVSKYCVQNMNTTTIATKETSSTRRIEQTDNGMVIIEESGNEVQEQDWVDRNGMGSFEPFDSIDQRYNKVAIQCEPYSTRLEIGKRSSPNYAIWRSHRFWFMGPNSFFRK